MGDDLTHYVCAVAQLEANPLAHFDPVHVDLMVDDLPEDQAFALARLCQRCFSWTMLRGLAGSDREAMDMARALERVRSGLEQHGVSVS